MSADESRPVDLSQMDPTKVAAMAARANELLGPDGWLKVDAAHAESVRRWNQDVETIGRILRSHLYVEHYLNENLAIANPRIGNLSKARLSFHQKTELLDLGRASLAEIIGGIRHLNAIRNRLAHNLEGVVSDADAATFLQAKLFKAMRQARDPKVTPSLEPIVVLEHFAQHAAYILDSEGSPLAAALTRAGEELMREDGTKP